MKHKELKIALKNEDSPYILAHLSSIDFDSFWEEDGLIHAYFDEDKISQDDIVRDLIYIKSKYSFQYTFEALSKKNWNKVWEANFKPVYIDNFCVVRGSFHEAVKTTEHEIIIDPEMAFGTAHHETTYMLIEAAQKLNFKDKYVLDYGCGTSILAILASKLGAKSLFAIDNDQNAVDISKTNFELNKVKNIIVKLAEIQDVPDLKFDIIFANINRNVLIDTRDQLLQRIANGGIVLISGVLKKDIELVESHYTKNGLITLRILQKGEWVAIIMQSK